MPSILVVEDEKNIARAVRDRLAKEGFEVSSVNSGREALSVLEQSLPDLIILDLLMPGMDGYEVVRRVRSDERTRAVKILLLTVLPEEEKETELDVDAWVTKPYKSADLIEKVCELVGMPPAKA